MIDSFRREYAFLSNFHSSTIVYEGIKYPTVEHAFQAAKTIDQEQRRRIASALTPARAKQLGRRLRPRPDWDSLKLRVMEECLRAKFSDPALRSLLVATGDEELVEGNRWGDRFWGACEGTGENHLGLLLMKIRSELRR